MSLINFFLSSNNKNTANIAKKRLHLLIEKQKKNEYTINHFNALRKDILNIINKYVKVTESISMNIYNKKNNISILEINIQYRR